MSNHATAPSFTPRAGFWRRRLLDPLLAQLKQGVTPDKLSATLAVGTVCSLFPFLGTTTLLNLGVGLWFRMNQAVLQALNQLLAPVHIASILLYVHLGEMIWRAPDTERFTITELLRSFSELSIGAFLHRFGRAGVHALTAWVLTAPFLMAALYYLFRPILRRFAASRAPTPREPNVQGATGS